MSKGVIRDEEGFTVLGMTVALLVSLSLVLSCAQVYRVQVASAAIQDVADASAMATEDAVAEFVTTAQVCDAVLLSLSLTATASTGLGIVCLCSPATVSLSPGFLHAAEKCVSARNSFGKTAQKALNVLQRSLPFVAAVRAAQAAAGNQAVRGGEIFALGVTFPLQAEAVELQFDEKADREFFEKAETDAAQVEESARKAEEAAEAAETAKMAGFEADCGRMPNRCMCERASALSGIVPADNPRYQTIDAWSFSIALERARAYYAQRLVEERPHSADVYEQARSILRKRFYEYACDQLAEAYVYETEAAFEAFLPRFFRNTEGLRQTSLYDEAVYPVTVSEEGVTMHAYAGCPCAVGSERLGSIREMDRGEFLTCDACRFTVESLGSVAAATSSVDSGFEFHYLEMVQAATDYQKARAQQEPYMEQVEESLHGVFDRLADYCKTAQGCRISVSPPGKDGALSLAVDLEKQSSSLGFGDSLVRSEGTLGARAAVAGATIIPASSDEGRTVLNSLLDGMRDEAQPSSGVPGVVLDCWSGLLGAYADGSDVFLSAVEEVLDDLPLVSRSGLGTWAADKLASALEAVGLQPASLKALKPVLVNTSYVAEGTDDALAKRFLACKGSVLEKAQAWDGLSAWAASALESQKAGYSLVGDCLEVAQLEFPGGEGVTFPLVVTLPPGARSALDGLLGKLASGIAGVQEAFLGVKRWA